MEQRNFKEEIHTDLRKLRRDILGLENELDVADRSTNVIELYAEQLLTITGRIYDTVYDLGMVNAMENAPDLDEVFKDDPVSKYTQATTDYHMNAGNEEAQQEAVQRAQKALEDINGPNENRVEDFVTNLVDSLDFDLPKQEEYKEEFSSHLADALNLLEGRAGDSKFIVTIGEDVVTGSIYKRTDGLEVVIQGKSFFLDSPEPMDEYEYEYDEDEYDDEYDDEDESWRDDYPEEYKCGVNCGCVHECEEEGNDEPSLFETTQAVEYEHLVAVQKTMDQIEQELSDRVGDDYSEEDIQLIRFYLKNLPFPATSEDVDDISDKAAILAFRFRQYAKGKLN